MKEQKITFCKGLPGSGKSTWAKEEVKKSQGSIKRVNKDDLRAMLDVSVWSKSNEAFMLGIRDEIIRQALNDGLSIIVDDTNLEPKHEARFKELAECYTKLTGKLCSVELKDFTDVSPTECIRRDALRTGTAHVGEKVIMGMYNKYLKKPDPKYVPPVEGLPRCIICDLDGTLALLNGRDPYDATTCDKDEINKAVQETIYGFQGRGYKIIFMSGREDKYEAPTRRFLQNVVDNYSLFMRKTGDQRKDAIVKRELFDAHIHGNYNPLFVLDDRQQVVDMWRKQLGLTVFQVAEGLF